MMKLDLELLKRLNATDSLKLPTQEQLTYPEKVLQFGTGVLLRGLPDQYIHEANRDGVFKGRVVVVKSTSNGSTDAYADQHGLYTLCVKGVKDGKRVEEYHINASISRVVSATAEWNEIIALAKSDELEVVISNTTEVGIIFVEESIHEPHPSSFPGKLLSVLFTRYQHFNGNKEKGLVILPTELIEGNGTKLSKVLNELALFNNLDVDFISWLNECNPVCNTLVDRIVPGKLSAEMQAETADLLGYEDDLMIMAEPYALWAIESSNPKVNNTLSFCSKTNGAFIVPSIEKYKEIKLRLLNATHTFSCGVSLLAGMNLVKDSMSDPQILDFIKKLSQLEIASVVANENISNEEADQFAAAVIDRFSNPFLEHKWLSISAQFTLKMKTRCIPLIQKASSKNVELPHNMIIGLSAYILCMKTKQADGHFEMQLQNGSFPLTDDLASMLHNAWKNDDVYQAVSGILSNVNIWGEDLSHIHGLIESVVSVITDIQQHGIKSVI
jgi:tagaturonate reductase